LGYGGKGAGPSAVGGRILASLALGRRDDEVASLPIVGDRARPRAFPPEPFRYAGARAFREAIAIRERAEEAGDQTNPVIREISRLPRRVGYHLGPARRSVRMVATGPAVLRRSRSARGGSTRRPPRYGGGPPSRPSRPETADGRRQRSRLSAHALAPAGSHGPTAGRRLA